MTNFVGREIIRIIQIDQPQCIRIYGTAPCTASLSLSNPHKCYNTRATCQDPNNYRPGTKQATVTLTIASPCVITWNGHGLAANTEFVLETTGALPTGLTAGIRYYVINPLTNTFNVAAAPNGTAINTSGSQSGVHTAIANLPVTLTFVDEDQVDNLKFGPAIPSLLDVKTTPGAINLAGMTSSKTALGDREVVNIRFRNHAYSDLLVDKYREERLSGGASLSAGEVHFDFIDGAEQIQPHHGSELATVTFTRSGATATRVNSQGLIETVAANTPRFDHDPVTLECKGLLIEEARTNLIENSDVEDDAVGNEANNVSSSARDQTHVIHGSWSMKVGINNAASSGPYWRKRSGNLPFDVVAGTTYAFSVWVYAEADAVGKLFNLRFEWGVSTSTVAQPALVAGWQRLEATATAPVGATTCTPTLYTAAAQGAFNIWHELAQFEPGSFATSAIPTTTGAATRNPDVATVSDISGFYNASEGTLVAEWIPGALGITAYVGAFYGNAVPTTNRINIVQASSNIAENSVNNSGFQCSLNTGALTLGSVFRSAFAWKANDFAASGNGGAVQTDGAGTLPTVDRFGIGLLGVATQLNGHIRRLTYYPRRLINSQLVELSGSRGHPSSIVPFDLTFDPSQRGTFWGKWKNRNPYYPNYNLRVYEGYVDQTLAQMRVRHYVMSNVATGIGGDVEVTAKDQFVRLERKKAVAPFASEGELVSNIAASGVTSFTIQPVGIGAKYGSSGYVNIGDEIIQYTRASDVFTVVARAALNTTAAEHKAEDLVQEVLQYSTQLAHDIVYDLLTRFSEVPISSINKTQWDIDAASLTELYTTRIATPTPVNDLVSELSEQAGFTLFANPATGMIEFIPLRAAAPVKILTDDQIVEDNISFLRQDDKRLTQVWVYYAQINPVEDLEEKRNYRSRLIVVNLDNEGPDKYGTPVIKEIFSRWIPQFGRSIAESVAERILDQFLDPPSSFRFTLPIEDVNNLGLGDLITVQVSDLEQATGDQATETHAIVAIKRMPEAAEAITQQVRFGETPTGDRVIIIENSVLDFNLRTVHDTLFSVAQSGDVVRCIINAGVTVGSSSTVTPAWDTGTWAVGVILEFINNGTVFGAGGQGGTGGFASVTNATVMSANPGGVGGQGGTALKVQHAITINNTNGHLWGGGGGGGGGPGFSAGAEDKSGGEFNDASYVAAGGSGGGGGRGGTGGLAGSGGGASAPPFGSGGRTVSGASGNVGSSTNPGTGGTGQNAQRIGNAQASATGGAGGTGGGPGLPGNNGSPGSGFATNLASNGTSGDVANTASNSGGIGGAAGKYVEGNSLVTWDGTGDRLGNFS